MATKKDKMRTIRLQSVEGGRGSHYCNLKLRGSSRLTKKTEISLSTCELTNLTRSLSKLEGERGKKRRADGENPEKSRRQKRARFHPYALN